MSSSSNPQVGTAPNLNQKAKYSKIDMLKAVDELRTSERIFLPYVIIFKFT